MLVEMLELVDDVLIEVELDVLLVENEVEVD